MRNIEIKKGFFQGFYYLIDHDNDKNYTILHNAIEKNWNKWSVYEVSGKHGDEYDIDHPIGVFQTLNESLEWLSQKIGADDLINPK